MSTAEQAQFTDILNAHDYRLTAARQATFNALLHAEPLTMAELIAKTGGDRVSVYRSVELFEKLGIVRRIYIGWKYKLELSDQFTVHHHHLVCLQCGRTIDVADEAHIDEFISSLAREHNFAPLRHQFEIEGYCTSCRN